MSFKFNKWLIWDKLSYLWQLYSKSCLNTEGFDVQVKLIRTIMKFDKADLHQHPQLYAD